MGGFFKMGPLKKGFRWTSTLSGLHSYPCDVLGKNVGHFGPKPTSGFVMTTLIDETYSFHS